LIWGDGTQAVQSPCPIFLGNGTASHGRKSKTCASELWDVLGVSPTRWCDGTDGVKTLLSIVSALMGRVGVLKIATHRHRGGRLHCRQSEG
jgi:hypothetical protein